MNAPKNVSEAKEAVQRLKQNPERREQLRREVRDYLNLPVVLAALLIVLLAYPWLSGHPSRVWRGAPVAVLFTIWALLLLEFAVKFALAPNKIAYVRRHWWGLLIALVPVVGIVRLAIAIRQLASQDSVAAPHLAILRRRGLDKLALISVLVTFIGATLALLFENGAHGTTITSWGVAVYWSAALITTVASQLYPVTPGGQAVSLALMIYSVAFFTYLTSSLASALIGGDVQQANAQTAQAVDRTGSPPAAGVANEARPAPGDDGARDVRLTTAELAVLRAILERAGAGPQ
jgi:voltage-gated potassium channel